MRIIAEGLPNTEDIDDGLICLRDGAVFSEGQHES